MNRSTRRILALILLVPFVATGAALAAEPAVSAGATTDAEAGVEAPACSAPLFDAAAALAGSGEVLDQAEDAAPLCRQCSIGNYTCNGKSYCDNGNGCCYPLADGCPWICV